MEDRELLGLAAKAAGIEGIMLDNGMEVRGYSEPDHRWRAWNPLVNDGDALRLAVKLDIGLIPMSDIDVVVADGDFRETYHRNRDYAATRRAIVRAAAEIGRNMP